MTEFKILYRHSLDFLPSGGISVFSTTLVPDSTLYGTQSVNYASLFAGKGELKGELRASLALTSNFAVEPELSRMKTLRPTFGASSSTTYLQKFSG